MMKLFCFFIFLFRIKGSICYLNYKFGWDVVVGLVMCVLIKIKIGKFFLFIINVGLFIMCFLLKCMVLMGFVLVLNFVILFLKNLMIGGCLFRIFEKYMGVILFMLLIGVKNVSNLVFGKCLILWVLIVIIFFIKMKVLVIRIYKKVFSV